MKVCPECKEKKENSHFYMRQSGKPFTLCKTCHQLKYGNKRISSAHTPFKLGSSPNVSCEYYNCKAPYLYCKNKQVINRMVHDSILIGCNTEESTTNGACAIIEY